MGRGGVSGWEDHRAFSSPGEWIELLGLSKAKEIVLVTFVLVISANGMTPSDKSLGLFEIPPLLPPPFALRKERGARGKASALRGI